MPRNLKDGAGGPLLDEDGIEILNLEAYDEYQKVSTSQFLKDAERHTCSDGRVVNLKKVEHQLKAQLDGLKPPEIKKVMALKKRVKSEMTKASNLKRKYRGLSVGKTAKVDALTANRDRLIDLFSRGFSVSEVKQIAFEEWGHGFGEDQLTTFRQKNFSEIADRMDSYKSDFSAVRLSMKRSRLEELSYLYWRHKQRYEVTGSHLDNKTLLAVLEQLRKEVEGDRFTADINVQMQVEQVINIQQQEILKRTNLHEIVLARTAARLSISSLEVLSELHQSYYARYNSYVSPEPSREIDIPYPSEIGYDMDTIQSRKLTTEMVMQQALEGPAQPIESAKQRLLEALKRKQNELVLIKKTDAEKNPRV